MNDGLPAPVADRRPVGGGDIGRAEQVRLTDGRLLFVKHYSGTDGPAMAATEAAGLAWLAEVPGGPAVPEVVAVTGASLALAWVETGPRSPVSDERLGRELAGLHRAGAPAHGGADGFLGSVAVPGRRTGDWATFWVQARLEPLVARARSAGALDDEDAGVLLSLADVAADRFGPPEPPARLHGDLWWGNVLPGADGRVWLVDPAAHGGHREADLAMLDLFGGVPDALLRTYGEVWPLADGWPERVALHQLTPLLVHAALFGGGYGARAVAVARRYR